MAARPPAAPGVVAAATLGLGAFLALAPEAPVSRDASFYLYFAQATADGAVLYRDLYETKTPLSILFGSLVVRAADRLGCEPVPALRAAFPLCALATWLLALGYALRRAARPGFVALPIASLLAWTIPFSLPATGVVPKTLLILISALQLHALEARARVCCGLLASLAFLDWQVGGLLLPATLAAALFAGWRSRDLALVGLGFALGLAGATALFALQGAAGAFWSTAVAGAARSEAASAALPTLAERGLALARAAREAAGPAAALLGAAHLLGIALAARLAKRTRSAAAGFAAAYALAMTGMAFVEMDGVGDLYPCVAAGALAQFVAAIELGTAAGRSPARIAAAAVAALAALAAAAGARGEPEPAAPRFALADQRRIAQRLFRAAAPERVVSVGYPELHLLARRIAPGRFVYFSQNTYRALRRRGEDWPAALARELAQAGAEAAIVARSQSWDGDRRYAELGGPGPADYRLATLREGSLCYELLVRADSSLAAELALGDRCEP